jgi:2-C-methyl-D-erythritol 2,4-cyclodiphosphate synthase
VCNVDASVVAEQPRLTPFISEMRGIISEALGIDAERVGVKSTTSKGLGFLGKGEGIAAHAVALVEKTGE